MLLLYENSLSLWTVLLGGGQLHQLGTESGYRQREHCCRQVGHSQGPYRRISQSHRNSCQRDPMSQSEPYLEVLPRAQIIPSVDSRKRSPRDMKIYFLGTPPVTAVPDIFREYSVRPLSERIAVEGFLDAANIGAARQLPRSRTEIMGKVGSCEPTLTQFRRLWHVLFYMASLILQNPTDEEVRRLNGNRSPESDM